MVAATVFKTIYLPHNCGHGDARRTSLENCSNELIALMDADDISLPYRFEKQLVEFKKNEELDIVGGQITEFVGQPANITGKRAVPESDADIKIYMKKRCPMNQVSVMFKKSFVQAVGGYIDWFCEEDYYLWIRMAEANGVFANVPETLVNVRVGDEMSSRRGGWKYFASETRLQFYMLKKRMISFSRYLYNVAIRFGGEVLITDHARTKLFQIMREPYKGDAMMPVPEDREYYVGEYPPFSVAMCVYGGDNPDWFDAALRSVIEQTVKPNEIVLVVDGPIPDSIQNVIEKYTSICNAGGGTVLRVIRLKKNSGHGVARRTGLQNCSFGLIALMDADDLSVPDRFEKQLRVFENNPDLSIVGGNIREFINTPDNCVGRRVVPETDDEIKEYMKKRCPMNQMTVMFRKEAVHKAGGYLDWYCDEDYYLWIRMALAGCSFSNISDDLVNVRVGKEMYQRRGGMRYFKSEAKLQKYMLANKIISLPRYLINVSERLILQMLMPNRMRGFIFRKLARSK